VIGRHSPVFFGLEPAREPNSPEFLIVLRINCNYRGLQCGKNSRYPPIIHDISVRVRNFNLSTVLKKLFVYKG
jgi:hypothetical protein